MKIDTSPGFIPVSTHCLVSLARDRALNHIVMESLRRKEKLKSKKMKVVGSNHSVGNPSIFDLLPISFYDIKKETVIGIQKWLQLLKKYNLMEFFVKNRELILLV